MLRVGLTGGIGSGKTTVSDMFQQLGTPVIDTDVIAHQLVNDSNAELLQQLSDTFGCDIIDQQGQLDRKKLAGIVFNDENRRHQLEAILHPRIRQQVTQQLDSMNNKKDQATACNYCIIVIPLLFETGFRDIVDTILVVTSATDTRIERIRQRDSRTLDEIRSIINSQVNDDLRLQGADDSLENNSDLNALRAQVLQLHNKYQEAGCSGG